MSAPPSMTSKLVQRLATHGKTTRLLHESLREDADLALRAKLYGFGSLTFLICATIVSIPYFLQEQIHLGLLTLSFALCSSLSLVALRETGSLSAAAHLTCLALFGATVSGYAVLGGVSSVTNKWLIVMPMVCLFSGKRAVTLTWVLIALLTPVVFDLLFAHGVFEAQLVFSKAEFERLDLLSSLLFIVMITLFAFTTYAHNAWAIAQLEEREHALSARNVDLTIARDEAIRANKARDRFLSNMSHELRTPLNAIVGYSEMIQEELHDDDVTRHDEEFERIDRAGRRLLMMLQDILELTKFESSAVKLKEESMSLVDLLERARKEHPREVELDVPQNMRDARLRTHGETLSNLLHKLLDNACHFTRLGDYVGIKVSEIKPGEETFTLSIIDHGAGIDAIDLERVWEPFFQVDGSATRSHDGAGLGLPLVQHFAKSLSMEVALYSALGEGTQVVLTIPAALLDA